MSCLLERHITIFFLDHDPPKDACTTVDPEKSAIMVSVYKPVTLITGTTPTAAGMIALKNLLGNGAAKYGYRDFKASWCCSSRSSRRYIGHGSELCSEIVWPSVEV